MTVSNNYFHGNQGSASNPDFIDSLVYFDGNAGSAVSEDDTVLWNIFGGPGTNDCSNLMSDYLYPGLSGNGGLPRLDVIAVIGVTPVTSVASELSKSEGDEISAMDKVNLSEPK